MRALAFALALTLPATAFAQDAQPTGKLPDTVKPLAYRLDLTIIPENPRFSGHTEIDVQLNKAAQTVWMHGRGLNMTKAVAIVGGKAIPVTFTQKSPYGLAQLDFGKTVQPGKVTLKFDYDAPFGGGASGPYRINVAGTWYAWTQFESIDARAAFPGFDEPGYKTPFTVSLTTKPGFVALSNAPETGKPTKAGKLEKHRFIATKPLPTYLVAFVVGPFATVQTKVAATPERKTPLPLRIVGTQPNKDQMQFAADNSGPIVALLEKYFGQPFPFPKLDQIGSPVMPGAMENAGADIYGDGILFVDEKDATSSKQTFGMVVAHELSHQWFGDLVTPAWWDDIWLNESFANWMGYRIGNEWRPDLDIGVDAISEGFEAMDLDALVAGRPIHQHITNDADVDAAFDQITYGKGGQVVGMIAAYMGDEKFRDGVRLHMKRHEYGNASTEQFFGSLADAAHDPRVLASLKSFVDQQGVPVVTFHRENGGLTATQQRFAYFGTNAPAQQWVVPLCIRQGDAKNCMLLDTPSAPVTVNGTGAIVPNAGGWGYYRFDLDPADWDALIHAAPKLPTGEALAVDDSLWASFYAGKAKVPQLVALSRAMAQHPKTKMQLDNGERLAGLAKRGLIGPAALPGYRKLFVELYGPMLAKIGFDPKAGAHDGDDADTQELREQLVGFVADDGHDAATRAKLTQAADAWLAGDTKALDGDFAPLALAVTVEDRGVPFAKTLADAALAGKVPGLRQAAFRAIASSDNAEVAKWYFTEFNDPRYSSRERLFAAAAFMNNPNTRDAALDYMLAHFDEFSKSTGGGGIFSGRSAQMFKSQCTLAAADTVNAKLRGEGGSTLSLDRAVEGIRNCARFKDAKAGEVTAAFAAM
ncbi:M1 family metallopeptidase [Sphingomonas sp. KR3-1]|uniref:M1 family metallopeptidase n=1 Tax=Sphingomonas sp. KR3-1 TaxID=3156611 RepID=UPI0032B3710C